MDEGPMSLPSPLLSGSGGNNSEYTQHTKENNMSRNIETGPRWEKYQYAIKELAQNGAISLKEHTKWVYDDGKGKMANPLSDVVGHLATPNSHDARVRMGLTEQITEVTAQGAVLRVGHAEYIWDKEIMISGRRHNVLVTDDNVLIRWNERRWDFRKPRVLSAEVPEVEKEAKKAEEPVTFTLQPPVPAFTQPTTPTVYSTQMLEVLARDGDRLVLKNGSKIIIATITEEVGV